MVTLDTIQAQKGEILRIASEHGGHNLRVFGSIARGAATEESDIDLLVEMDEDRSLLDLIAIKLDLEETLGHKVDLVTEGALHRLIREEVLKEAITL
ncbi:MAG: nucleotidyltransferase family protein [Phycisphaerae bacterium]|nr:nucleotidyltransferase family protein [Phycisphaerae bacterium]